MPWAALPCFPMKWQWSQPLQYFLFSFSSVLSFFANVEKFSFLVSFSLRFNQRWHFFHIVNYFCGMPFSVECLFKLIYFFFHQNFIKIMLVFLVIKETVCEYWITTLCMFIFVFDDFSWLLLHLSIVPSKPSLSV